MFEIAKAEQIVAFFAMQEADKKINILKLIKLVYLADRKNIENCGYPISDDDYVSMPHGPVCSKIYDELNAKDLKGFGFSAISSRKFGKLIQERSNHMIPLVESPVTLENLDELSESDIETLTEIWQNFGVMDEFELRDWTHNPENIPEWQDPGRSSTPIDIKDIMRNVGIENVDEHYAELKSMQADIKALTS